MSTKKALRSDLALVQERPVFDLPPWDETLRSIKLLAPQLAPKPTTSKRIPHILQNKNGKGWRPMTTKALKKLGIQPE